MKERLAHGFIVEVFPMLMKCAQSSPARARLLTDGFHVQGYYCRHKIEM